MQKENYQLVLERTLKTIEKEERRPRLLLHSCCGPCSSYVLEYLSHYFDITVYYYNPNISPAAEFTHRAEEQQKLIAQMPLEGEVSCIVGEYDPETFFAMAKGRDKYNFGMAKPEGYRKAQRMLELADKFHLPVISFVDTAGAYPGVDAEARGQAEAIASSIEKCLQVKTPIISVIIGEGGSGGAIAIATANRVLMLEHSIYSVISPEGCASILWRSGDKTKEATEALRLTAQDLKALGIIDDIIKEPLGGAHRNPQQAMQSVKEYILRHLRDLENVSSDDLKKQRTEKFLNMGRQQELNKDL